MKTEQIDTRADQIKKRARERYGRGWDRLGPHLQRTAICEEIVSDIFTAAQMSGETATNTLASIADAALAGYPERS